MYARPIWILAALVLCTAAEVTAEVSTFPLRMVMPEDKRESSLDARHITEFDMETRRESRLKLDSIPDAGIRQTEGSDSIFPPADLSRGKDYFPEVLIANPTVGEYPRHVRLVMNFTDVNGMPVNGGCSGTLIGPRHVLTAAHCVYMWETRAGVPVNAWANTITVQPGFNNGVGPAGTASAISLRSWTGWTQDMDWDDDMALITLDRPVGALTGWRGFGFNNDWDFYDDDLWINYGYPATDSWNNQVYSGLQMYLYLGNYDYDDGDSVGFDYDAHGGTSGSSNMKNNIIYTVRSHGEPDDFDVLTGEVFSFDTYDARITQDKFNTILNWIGQDQSITPDLAVLDVQSDIPGGQTAEPITGLNFLAHNGAATAFSGSIQYTVYLSTDNVIDSNDIYVYDGSVTRTISSNGSTRIDVPTAAAVPSAPVGDYFLGVIIQATGDTNPNNDTTGIWDVQSFGLWCGTSGPPLLDAPDDDHPCIPTDITLAWGSLGTSVQYQVHLRRGTFSEYASTSITQHTFYGLDPASTYHWQVRGQLPCGSWSPWSPPRTFHTRGDLDQITISQPTFQEPCLGPDVNVSYSPRETAVLYRVRVTEVGGPTNYYDTTQPNYLVTGLLPATEYEIDVKAKNACEQWGSPSGRIRFTTRSTTAVPALQIYPIDKELTGPNPTLEASNSPSAQGWEFEVKDLLGNPTVYASDSPELALGPLAEGEYSWRVRMESCTTSGDQWSAWTAEEKFNVDATAPVLRDPPAISPQLPGVWTDRDLVNISWAAATDENGVAEYWFLFDQSPSTIPDPASNGAVVVDATSFSAESNLPHGANWLHFVAVDGQGNVSAAEHVGPILIDIQPPVLPTLTGSIPDGEYTNTTGATVSWTEPFDDSGVIGYSTLWSTSPGQVADLSVNTTGLAATRSVIGEGLNYFSIRAIDTFGQASDPVVYTFAVDRTAPTVELIRPWPGDVLATGSVIPVLFTAIDNIDGPNWMDYEHFYSVDGGTNWYQINACNAAHCGNLGGTWGRPGSTYWDVPWAPPGADVRYRIRAYDDAGNMGEIVSGQMFINSPTSVDLATAPTELLGNHPNPFNPRTTINFALQQPGSVRLDVLDLKGRVVRRLISESRAAGAHAVIWDGTDDAGGGVASGVYHYRLQTEQGSFTKRMTLLK